MKTIVALLIFTVSAITTVAVADSTDLTPPTTWPSCGVRAGSYCTGLKGQTVACYNCCQGQCTSTSDLNNCEACCPRTSACNQGIDDPTDPTPAPTDSTPNQ